MSGMADPYTVPDRLSAGVGRVDMTPPPDIPNGMWMAQRHVRAEGIHQTLWLTALALRKGGEAVIVLDIDWCLLSDRQDRAVRAAVSTATGVPSERVLPVCTHNHAGPVTQDAYRGEGEDDVHAYVGRLPAWAAEAAAGAMGALEPVRIVAGRGRSGIGANRDLRLPDGRAVAGPNPDGFADTEVGVVRVERLDGSPLAVLVNYACHPTVLGPDNRLVSPDYPGTTKRVVEEATGARCLFLQGAAGDMGPIETFVGDAESAERLGRRLGLEAAKVALELDARPVRPRLDRVIPSGAPLTVWVDEPYDAPEPDLAVARRFVRLPVRTPLPDLFEHADQRLARWQGVLEERVREGGDARAIAEAHQVVERERLRAIRADGFRNTDGFDIELQALMLGPVALLFAWGEPYARIGVEIKQNSPVADTFVVGYLGGDPTYVATPEAFTEPQPFQIENCPFAPSAAAEMVDAAVELLEEVAERVRALSHHDPRAVPRIEEP